MDVVTFGESMALFVSKSTEPLRFVNEYKRTFGGSESNVAIALSRLGHKVGWISRMGDDEFGYYIRNSIRGEGVDTSHVIFDSEKPTGVFFKERRLNSDPNIMYYRSNSAASMMLPEDINELYISKAKILHLTGITPALSDTCCKTVFRAIEMAHKNGLTIVFDPNIRLKLWTKSKMKSVLSEIISLCDVVLPGIDEGKLLTGKDNIQEIASSLLKGKCSTVIIKLGAQGAFFANNSDTFSMPGKTVKQIVDTAGAGDGFAAGIISGMLRGWSWKDCMHLGNEIGAYALNVEGDIEGYPYWEQIMSNKSKILR